MTTIEYNLPSYLLKVNRKQEEIQSSLYKKQQHIFKDHINNRISSINQLSANKRRLTTQITSMICRYPLVLSSQSWIAKQTNVQRETVNRNIKELNNLGIIKKIDRGYRINSHKKGGLFRRNTCQYKIGYYVKDLIKLINNRHPSPRQAIDQLAIAIPAVYLYIDQNVTDTNIKSLYNNITKAAPQFLYKKEETKNHKVEDLTKVCNFPGYESFSLQSTPPKDNYDPFFDSPGIEQERRRRRSLSRLVSQRHQFCKMFCGLRKKVRLASKNYQLNNNLLNFYKLKRQEIIKIVQKDSWNLQTYPTWMYKLIEEVEGKC